MKQTTTGDQPSSKRNRGQVLVIFAGALFLLMMMAAIVVDVSWYWVNSLKVQRAADAAALAGAVQLPAHPDSLTGHAYDLAFKEATKDGYTDGATVTGLPGNPKIKVVPLQDPNEPRRLNVTITAPIGTFFMRVIGIPAITVTRTSKAEFTLPVPMGSWQAYYGVGFYEGQVATSKAQAGTTNWQNASNSGTGNWASEDSALAVNERNNRYTSEDRNGDQQQWLNFQLANNMPTADPTLAIDGLEVQFTGASLTGSGSANDDCRFSVEANWNGGANGSWSSIVPSPKLSTSTMAPFTVGSQSDLTAWGAHPWVDPDFTNGNFRLRLTWNDGSGACPSTRSVQIDYIEVKVQYHTTVTTYTKKTLSVPNPGGGAALTPQNFWGAIFTPGGYRENGDRYAPSLIGNGTGANPNSANPDYTPLGYDYLVEVGGGGQVQLFDPEFCATGDNGHGGSFGAGDHWTDPGGDPKPVSVTYRLYDTKGTTANPNDDGNPIAFLRYDPGNNTLGDFSGSFGTPQNQGDTGSKDCANDAGHNKWVQIANGLAGGIYRLNVNTSVDQNGANDADNFKIGAENLFSIWVDGGAKARVYGAGRMAAYTNLETGNQQFYFMQIGKQYAGKTLEIVVFDPGECSAGNASLAFLNPDGNAYNAATFDWTADNGASGKGTKSIQTCNGGNALFNNRTITIEIDLAKTYGSVGLNPTGPPASEPGWWQVAYNINAANDTTTWQVSVKGNPVHLILP